MTDRLSEDVDLEFGVFDWLDAEPGRTAQQTYESRLRLVRLAEELGYARYHLAEHHGTPLGLAPSPGIFLTAAARETSRIRLVATTFIVPLYDPLRLAEEIGMIDQLSGGRLEIGVGKGSSPIEAAMFGHDKARSAELYNSYMPAILTALETGHFAWPPDAPGMPAKPIGLYTRPLQTPHPPLWYPTSNAASISRLAEERYHTIFGFGFASPPLEEIQKHSRTFFDAHRRVDPEGSGHDAIDGHPRFGMLRHVYVGRTDEEALAIAKDALAIHYASFTFLWKKAGDDRFAAALDVEDLVRRHLLFIGSAESVAKQVTHAVRIAEVNYLAGAFAWGSLTEQQSADSLDRFAGEVIPAVRAALPKDDSTMQWS